MPFQIVRNDITKIQLDAIVNTANPSPEDGLGTDAAEEDAIRNSYRSALSVAKAKGLRSIEIPFLASESFGLSKGTALRIALSEIDAFLSASDNDVMVYLAIF